MDSIDNSNKVLPVLLINLDRHPDRLKFMSSQLKERGIRFDRVSGSDGRNEEVLQRSRRSFICRLGPGAVGCFESHIRAWELLVSSESDAAVVLEDDVIVSNDFMRVAELAACRLEFDVIKLDHFSKNFRAESRGIEILGNRRAFRFLGGDWCTGGYIISRSGAQRLLSKARGYTRPVDNFMYDQESLLIYRSMIYSIVPATCVQLGHIAADDSRYPEFESSIVDRPILPDGFLMRSLFRIRAWARFESGPLQRVICKVIVWHISRKRGVVVVRNFFSADG